MSYSSDHGPPQYLEHSALPPSSSLIRAFLFNCLSQRLFPPAPSSRSGPCSPAYLCLLSSGFLRLSSPSFLCFLEDLKIRPAVQKSNEGQSEGISEIRGLQDRQRRTQEALNSLLRLQQLGNIVATSVEFRHDLAVAVD